MKFKLHKNEDGTLDLQLRTQRKSGHRNHNFRVPSDGTPTDNMRAAVASLYQAHNQNMLIRQDGTDLLGGVEL